MYMGPFTLDNMTQGYNMCCLLASSAICNTLIFMQKFNEIYLDLISHRHS